MSLGTKEKDPDSRLDYTIRWDRWLRPGDAIVESSWDVPEGLSYDGAQQSDQTTTVWLEGGTPGETYEVTNSIRTSAGRRDDKSFHIYVREG